MSGAASSTPGGSERLKKEGERIIAASRRPDGTYRKEIRIRAGYVPQDEVPIYQSKGALLKKAQPDIPPGLNPELLIKPKTKAAKRNEKKKEKRQQAALGSEKGKESESSSKSDDVAQSDSITDQMARVDLSDSNSSSITQDSSGQDLDKKIRAIKKKIRLAEAQLQGDPQNMKPEQLEKMKKMEGWHEELKILEGEKAENVRS